jgi:hypothetical protein
MKSVPGVAEAIGQQETSGFEPVSRLGGRDYSVHEGFGEYGYIEFDPDSDFDKI